MLTRLEWWLGVAAIVAALLGHALLPRYDVIEYRQATRTDLVRVDRWTGTVIGPASPSH